MGCKRREIRHAYQLAKFRSACIQSSCFMGKCIFVAGTMISELYEPIVDGRTSTSYRWISNGSGLDNWWALLLLENG